MFVSLDQQNKILMKINWKFFFPSLILVAGLAACGGAEGEKMKAETTTEENAESSADDDFVLPQPITLAQVFQEAGLPYVSGKTNPITNKEKYAQKIDQLLNLGVYSTDLAYCAVNNKTQEAREYLVAVQYLGSKVGLESVFSDKELIAKFDKNLGDKEALEELIYDIQDRSDVYMDDNDMRYLAAVQFAGAWVEGMYLGTDNAREKGGDLGKAMVEQLILLENIVEGLKNHPAKDDARLQNMIKQFETVLTTYKGFASVQKAEKNKNFEVPELTKQEFETLAGKIAALRADITKSK